MTNHWVDLKNADVILIDGSNAAENHPAAMTWINKAKDERGAKLIVVDPRFTRSASQADLYVPIRSGTDIAFFGGMMKYIIDKDLYHKEYVVHYTNAATLLVPEFKGPADLDGLFSGFVDEDEDGFGIYDRGTWKYQTDAAGNPLRDETLQNPHCVFQVMKRHYARYTLEKVSRITGCPQDKLEAAYKLYRLHRGSGTKPAPFSTPWGRPSTPLARRTCAALSMVQLLLGNLGRPGGGVNALRGESNVQGSTDQGVLAHLVTGYVGIPRAAEQSHPCRLHRKRDPQNGLLVEQTEISGQHAQGLVGRPRHRGESVCL